MNQDIAPSRPSPLRRSSAYKDLPSLESPTRPPNRRSYSSPVKAKPLQPIYPLAPPATPCPATPPRPLSAPQEQVDRPSIESWLNLLPEEHSERMWRASEKYGSTHSTPSSSPGPSSRQGRSTAWGVTRKKLVKICIALAAFIGLIQLRWLYGTSPPQHRSHSVGHTLFNATHMPNAAFQPPEPIPYRDPDNLDTFSSYKYRNTCNISSLDLHAPFAPLCQDRQSMLTAMSSGGRIGFDRPYMPRDCDMRWFSTEEICEILSRFEKVIVIGDSMMRHVIGSINVLIRKDLGYGAVTDWNFSPEERKDCFCNYQFNVKACSVQGIFKTADVVKNDPSSLACDAKTVDVMIEQMIRFPIPTEEIDRFKDLIGNIKPAKPYAFVYGHGLWNDLDLQATLDWLDRILEVTTAQLPYLAKPNAFWPRLFLTPNAAGKEKPDEWLVTQGNKALMLFEEAVGVEAKRRGVEHLGTWNMSIQSNKFDGVHLDLRGNLVKAMMVMNWLNLLEVEKH